ncbi:MAG: phosphohistidine phosphatase SixA [Pedosphaera sp.]|nr:phosphohistidine phosphatase SixA [Pedosphaera sp.]
MDLFILRHAIAEAKTPTKRKPDSERRLTPEGEKKMCRIAKGMKTAGLEFDLILSSPYVRAKQTAQIVANIFKMQNALELSPQLAPPGNPRKLIDELNVARTRHRSVLLVGHEPYLSRLISLLLSGDTSLMINLKKGGLCKLTAETLKYGRCATLEWLLTPRQLRDMD